MIPVSDHASLASLLRAVAPRAAATGRFGEVACSPDGTALSCAAPASAAPAWHRLAVRDGALWVELATPDRYLSQSIEQDLVHTGDKMDELFDEELADVADLHGLRAALPGVKTPRFEHFRDESKTFVFRTPVPCEGLDSDAAADRALLYLLACEQTFRPLGDMDAGAGDE